MRESHFGQRCDGLVERGGWRHPSMKDEGLGNLQADRQTRVERRERILEHDRDPVAAQCLSLRGGEIGEVAPREADRSRVQRRLASEQAHDCKRYRALA